MKKLLNILFSAFFLTTYCQDYIVPLQATAQRYIIGDSTGALIYGRGFDEDSNTVIFVVMNPNAVAFNGTRFSWLLSDHYKYDMGLRDSIGNEVARDILSYQGGFTRSAYDGVLTKSISAGTSSYDRWVQMTNSKSDHVIQSFECSYNYIDWNLTTSRIGCATDTNNHDIGQLIQATPQFIDLHWGYDGHVGNHVASPSGHGIRLDSTGANFFTENHENTVGIRKSGFLKFATADSSYIYNYPSPEEGFTIICTNCTTSNGAGNRVLLTYCENKWRKLF